MNRRFSGGWGGIFFILALLCPITVLASPLPHSANEKIRATFFDRQSGQVHLLWIEQKSGDHSRLLYQRRTLDGLPLGPAMLIQESQSRLRRPHLVMDGSGTLHALWQERFDKRHGARNAEGTWIHYARFTADSAQAGSILRQDVLNHRPLAQHPDLGVDKRGIAYAIWEEGRDSLFIAKVQGNRTVAYRHMTTDFGKPGHGYPALAVDGRGDVHMTWSSVTSVGTQQILYASLSHHGFNDGRLVASRVVFSSESPSEQPKRIRVANGTDRVTIVWKNMRIEGPLGRLAASDNRISFTVGHSSLKRVVVLDTFMTPTQSMWWSSAPAAVTGKPRMVKPSVVPTGLSAVPDEQPVYLKSSRTMAIDKLKLARLLAFTSWTGAPPSITSPVKFMPFPFSASEFAHLQNLRTVQPFFQSHIIVGSPVFLFSLASTGSISSDLVSTTGSALFGNGRTLFNKRHTQQQRERGLTGLVSST
jgi:hypothetical protein